MAIKARNQADTDFSDKLRNAIYDRGYTQAEVARELGIHPGTVYNWVAGRCRPSRLDHIANISLVVDCPPRDIL